MLIAALIAGMMIFSLFLTMLTQSPREVEQEEPVTAQSKPPRH